MASLSLALLAAGESELTQGIRHVKEGAFEEGLLTLDDVARELAKDPGRGGELAQAYLYLGVAYVALGQEPLARVKFRQALGLDGRLALSPEEFPPRVMRAFEAARRSLAEDATLERDLQSKKGRRGLVLLALGGAAAAGIALAVNPHERPNTPPTLTLRISPEGQALIQVTRMAFTATATDAEGDPLSYSWSFGDGESGAGPDVTHVYAREGTFSVRLTVSDGLTTTEATGSVTARSIAGVWRAASPAFDVGEYTFRQDRATIGANMAIAGRPHQSHPGSLADPRSLAVLEYPNGECNPADVFCPCRYLLSGTFEPGLQGFSGTVSCEANESPTCGCRGQRQAVTLSRP